MSTPTTSKKPDVRAQARAREIEVLKALASTGWMLTRQVALWVWVGSTQHVAVNKASAVLKRLETAKEVLKRKGDDTPTGVPVWVLAKRGAERLNAQLESDGFKGWAHHGYDVGLFEWSRTSLATDYLCDKLRAGAAGAIGAAGLRAGIVPALTGCDGAYFKPNSMGSYTAVGVLAVTNAREGICDKLRKMQAHKLEIDLAGDPRTIATVRRRAAV
jgi:hypothetical protein